MSRGGAGLFSTINDYSKFADMLCRRGCYRNSRIISEKAFDYMTTPKFNEHLLRSMWDRLNGYNYSCFMRVMTDVSRSRIKSANGEFGWDGWTGTYFCVHPESGITVLYFTQICGAGTTDQAVDIVNTVFGELL
ncbi:MAG TPA: serine hydrolase [Ruminococcus flavefaciens]|nr:serine hydrolase [Ruminococcus flavefaciens]